jgi:hypothetical protein
LDGFEEIIGDDVINNLFERLMPFQETNMQLMAKVMKPNQVDEMLQEEVSNEKNIQRCLKRHLMKELLVLTRVNLHTPQHRKFEIILTINTADSGPFLQ